MRKNIILFFLMFFIAALARAEKTYKKDSAECEYQGERITLDIRSKNLITESPDDSYGEILQIRHQGKIYPVNTGDQIMGRYRLVMSDNPLCNKPLAMKTSNEEIAIFLAKDNRPFADTLFVLYYNLKSRSSDFVQSKIHSSSAFYSDGKTYFKLASSERAQRFGSEIIDSAKFQYIEKTLEPWISFDGKNFRLDRDMTYEKFEKKNFLKRTDLDELSEFRELRYKFATNPKLGKSCLSFNHQDWICR